MLSWKVLVQVRMRSLDHYDSISEHSSQICSDLVTSPCHAERNPQQLNPAPPNYPMASNKHLLASSHESFHGPPSSLLDPSDWCLFYPTPLEPLTHSFDQLDTRTVGAACADPLVFAEPACASDFSLLEDLLQTAQTDVAGHIKPTTHGLEMVEISVHDLQLLLSVTEVSIGRVMAMEGPPKRLEPEGSKTQHTHNIDDAPTARYSKRRKAAVFRAATSSTEPSDPANDDGGSPQPGNKNACDFPGCGKVFTRPFNLRTHQKTHESVRTRNFRCDECGAAFLRVHDLVRHQVKHDPARWHICSGCRRQFSRVDALKRHIKTGNGACKDAVA